MLYKRRERDPGELHPTPAIWTPMVERTSWAAESTTAEGRKQMEGNEGGWGCGGLEDIGWAGGHLASDESRFIDRLRRWSIRRGYKRE